MDLLTCLSRHVFAPLYQRQHGVKSGPIRRSLMKSRYYSEDQIQSRQWQALLEILRFTYKHNRFYRKRFDAVGLTPVDIKLPEKRKVIKSVFGDIVFDRYGCEEVSLIASECETHDGLYITADGIYVEILDGSSGVPGRLIITDLTNPGMPFIRYEVGDPATSRTGRGKFQFTICKIKRSDLS